VPFGWLSASHCLVSVLVTKHFNYPYLIFIFFPGSNIIIHTFILASFVDKVKTPDPTTLLGLLCMQGGADTEWSPGRWRPIFIAIQRTCWRRRRLILLAKSRCAVLRVVFQRKRDSITGTNLVVEGNGGCMSQDFLASFECCRGGYLVRR